MPAGFRWLEGSDIWLPLASNSVLQRGRAVRVMFYVGRLKSGVTRVQAQAELETIATGLAKQFPASNTSISVRLIPLHEEVTGSVRPVLLALLGAVGLVLLISCVNIASLLMARSSARSRETAIRLSLGATRSRLIAQWLTESILLATVGGIIGLALAFWGVDLLVHLSPVDVPRRNEIEVDSVVLYFTLGVSVLSGVLFGLFPALYAPGTDMSDALKEGGRGLSGSGRHHTRRLLVVTEVALSLVVVTSFGLLLRSFAKLQGVDPGFNTERVLSLDLPMPSRYQEASTRLEFYKRFYNRVEALPGVVAVGDVTRLPLAGRYGNPTTMLAIEGVPVAPGDRPQVDFRRAGRNYFRAMGIALLSGRWFEERDTPSMESVAIINQAAARRFFPGQDPLGKRIGFGNMASPQWNRIVGVVGDVRHLGLRQEPRPEVYIAASQAPPFSPIVVVRSSVDTSGLPQTIRAVLRELDPEVPIFNVLTLEQIYHQSLAHPRFQVLLFGWFGAAALFLAMVGVYGVMAYSVSQRTHEVGIRLALGARRRNVVLMVVGEGMKLAAAGIVLGVPAALGAGHLLERILFGVTPRDTLTYTAVALLLAVATLAACIIPARRAARVDPLVALRYE
jgi:putative ABC transport system permease protein